MKHQSALMFADMDMCENASGDPNEVISKTFETLRQSSRIDFYAITHVAPGGARSKNDYVTEAVTNYPEEWVTHYTDTGLVEHDPVVAYAPHTTTATPWSALENVDLMTRQQRKTMAYAQDYGLNSGLFFSTRQFSGGMQVISFASRDKINLSPEELTAASTAGSIIATQLAGINRSPPAGRLNPLSDRERECLTWAAVGKASVDIELIMGISRNTVDFHIKNAMAKLDAGSRIYAIVKAIRLGLINP